MSSQILLKTLEKGVLHLNDAIKYWRSLGNPTLPVWGHLALGDVYARMAMGTMKLPPDGKLHGIWFIVRNFPLAHRTARRHYEQVVRSAKAFDMPWLLARALYSLGALSQANRRHKEARSYYEEALTAAETSEFEIAEKIRSALNSF